ncbi:hypothetical protein OIN60_03020 [Paenibacillus sp. P96]|uniref:Uncharacterized protein n=1 Tax=Paenibacillus zeirhizosphaerae TaxID=2987519 RepID=A0ABT9FLZ7_9BACL|nr:hypothetical protein [Paenibacillus sp. P96]MDP4095762.1 hypothetical protein [Paenibacillus sp. P96]
MNQPISGKQGHDKPESRLKYFAMIAWIALTFFFTALALIGLVVLAAGGSTSPYEKISTSTLLIVAAGGILLIEALTRFMDRPDDGAAEDAAPEHNSRQGRVPEKPRLRLKSTLLYVVLVVVILVGGIMLNRSLPVFTVSPWTSLIIAVVGWAGLKPLFLRKKKQA